MAKEKALAASVKPDKMDDYEAEEALRTLERAEDHKMNPELMKKVRKLAGRKVKHLKGISSIQDLKDIYNEKYGAKAKKGE